MMKNSSNLDISCIVVFSLNKWNKKVGSPSPSPWRKRQFISLNSPVFIENRPSFERACTNHGNIDVQKGCAMQLNGITLEDSIPSHYSRKNPKALSENMINDFCA